MTRKLLFFIPLLIVLLAFSLRFWHIASDAPGISGDEVDYPLTAKSFYLSGQDLGNVIHPLDVLSFQYPKTDDVKAELPYLLLMPFVGPFPFSLPLERIIFVLCSVATVWLIYAITKELLGIKAGIIAGLLGAINPFMVVLGRTTYEVVPATFFFMLALYLTLKARRAQILLVLPVLLCGFYAYIATKVLLVPFALLLALFGYFYVQKKKDGAYYFSLVVMCILFTLLYVVLIHVHIHGGRLGDLLTPSSPQIAPLVDSGRKVSLQGPLTTVTVNKLTIYGQLLLQNLFPIFSSTTLFIVGDGFFRLYNFGVLYYLDGLFLLVGLIFLFREKPRLGFFLIGFLLVSILPQVLYDSTVLGTNYSHTTLMFPFLTILSACGVASIFTYLKNKLLQKIAIISVAILYLVSTIFFIQAYFYQYPLHGESDYATRLLSRYISLASQTHEKVVVFSPVSSTHFKKYLFYANALNASTINQVKKAFKTGNMQLGNVSFTSCAHTLPTAKNTIYIEDVICGNPDFTHHDSVPLIIDGGTAYKIYNDSVCRSYDLKPYPTDLTLSDLNVENMPKQQFCETFITGH